MATILKNIVRFTGLVVGVPVVLPHLLNVNGFPVLPRLVFPNEGGHVVSANTLTVTVTRTISGTDSVDVYVEFWHTIEALVPLPGQLAGLVPFVLDPGAGGVMADRPISLPEQWAQQNVLANQTDVPLSALVSTNFDTIKAIRPGSIIGLGTRLTEAITAGTLTVQVTINGAGGTLVLMHTNVLNSTGGEITQATGIDTYVAGDLIGIQFSTTAGFTPITTDLEAWLEVQE